MRRIRFLEDATIEVQETNNPQIPQGFVRVAHQYSLISAGTELLRLSGAMGAVASERIGYSGVGRIIDGAIPTGFSLGDLVFTRGPHQDIVDISAKAAQYDFVKIDPEHAKHATFLELGKVAFHGLHRANIQLGDSVVVFGLGIVGNLVAQLASLATGAKVYVLDPVAERRILAKEMGLQAFDPSSNTDIDAIKLHLGAGAEVVMEASGSQEALNSSFKLAAPRGQIILVAGHYRIRELDLKTDFQNKELSLIATRRLEKTDRSMSDRWTVAECRREFYELLKKDAVDVEALISHTVSPNRAPEMYSRLLGRESGVNGVVFDWGLE